MTEQHRSGAVPSVHRATATAAAYLTLASHRTDPDSGSCLECARPGPCPPANDAANAVVALGLALTERRLRSRLLRRTAHGAVASAFSLRWRLGLTAHPRKTH